MNQQRPKFLLAPLAAAITATVFNSAPVLAQQGAVLEEVIVTARKRTESVMDIPSSIQALSEDDLKAMNATGMEDYSRFMPSVNVATRSPGTSIVVFRGAIIDSNSRFVQSTSSVYLDEISVTSTGDQPGIRMVDIERVEALAGPQGTLYGSDAQAGTMRIITNKPVMDEFEVVVDGSLKTGSDSDESYDGSVVLNLPLIDDKLALRLVAFGATDGGYIDNVLGHTPNTNAVQGDDHLQSGFGTLDNSQYVEDNWNEADTTGWRASLRWNINENWTATAGILHQKIESGADNAFDPNVGDLEIIRFFDDYREDEYDMYSLTVEADLGFAQLISATSYYDREIENEFDNTAYHHYWSANDCHTTTEGVSGVDFEPTPGNFLAYGVYCAAPTVEGDYLTKYSTPAEQERFTQEFRLSSQGDTIDWLLGLYYEDSTNSWGSFFGIPTSNDYQDSISLQYHEFTQGRTFPEATTHWAAESSTEWQQTAVFGEVVWHINDQLNLTVGGRYFERDNDGKIKVDHPQTQGLPFAESSGSESEFVPKISVSYNLNDDSMVYALWTEGYRPGGTQSQRGEPFFPASWEADKLTNYEIGYKATFLDGAARTSITAFYMDWEDFQTELTDPSVVPCFVFGVDAESVPNLCGQPFNTSVGNVGNAHILGASVELDWAVSESLVVGMNAEWLEAETDEPSLDIITNPITDGMPLPLVPDWTGAAWATYSWPVDAIGGSAYARLQWSYTGETVNQLVTVPADGTDPNPSYYHDAYNIGDFSLGLEADSWTVALFVNNLTDERAHYDTDTGHFEWAMGNTVDGTEHTSRVWTNRPREYGIRFTKRWGG